MEEKEKKVRELMEEIADICKETGGHMFTSVAITPNNPIIRYKGELEDIGALFVIAMNYDQDIKNIMLAACEFIKDRGTLKVVKKDDENG